MRKLLKRKDGRYIEYRRVVSFTLCIVTFSQVDLWFFIMDLCPGDCWYIFACTSTGAVLGSVLTRRNHQMLTRWNPEGSNRHTYSTYYAGNVRKELCSCSFAAGWVPGNYMLERFPTRNIKHEAVSLSTCSVLLSVLIKGFHSPTLLTRGIAVSWQLGE